MGGKLNQYSKHIPMREFARVSGKTLVTIRITVKLLTRGLWGKENITELLEHLNNGEEVGECQSR